LRRTVVHATVLSWDVRADTLQGQAVPQLSATLQRLDGLNSAVADLAAVSMMLGRIAQEASVLAFGDAYRITFFAALLALCLAVFLPGRIKADPTAMPGGH
jgi:hypothetical protein